MASHTRGPRGRRPRKPRPSSSQTPDRERSLEREQAKHEQVKHEQTARKSRSESRPPVPAQTTFGERPPAPWHPLPLSELLILAGAIAFVLAVSRLHKGPSSGGPLLLVGILAVVLGTVEVTWREHSSGYRSHTLLLALLPVIALHSFVVLGFTFLDKPSQVLNVGMFAVDIALFIFLFRVLRGRFLDARARAASRG